MMESKDGGEIVVLMKHDWARAMVNDRVEGGNDEYPWLGLRVGRKPSLWECSPSSRSPHHRSERFPPIWRLEIHPRHLKTRLREMRHHRSARASPKML